MPTDDGEGDEDTPDTPADDGEGDEDMPDTPTNDGEGDDDIVAHNVALFSSKFLIVKLKFFKFFNTSKSTIH